MAETLLDNAHDPATARYRSTSTDWADAAAGPCRKESEQDVSFLPHLPDFKSSKTGPPTMSTGSIVSGISSADFGSGCFPSLDNSVLSTTAGGESTVGDEESTIFLSRWTSSEPLRAFDTPLWFHTPEPKPDGKSPGSSTVDFTSTCRWMWADAGVSPGLSRRLSKRNPLRWSKVQSAQDTLAQFKRFGLRECSKRVRLEIRSRGQSEVMEFPSVLAVRAYLEKTVGSFRAYRSSTASSTSGQVFGPGELLWNHTATPLSTEHSGEPSSGPSSPGPSLTMEPTADSTARCCCWWRRRQLTYDGDVLFS